MPVESCIWTVASIGSVATPSRFIVIRLFILKFWQLVRFADRTTARGASAMPTDMDHLKDVDR